jgi:hypothetical protein
MYEKHTGLSKGMILGTKVPIWTNKYVLTIRASWKAVQTWFTAARRFRLMADLIYF